MRFPKTSTRVSGSSSGVGWEEKKRQELTHGNAQQADDQLHRPEHVEYGSRPGAVLLQPVVRFVRQTVAEEVLEDDETGETLDGEVACWPTSAWAAHYGG